MNQHLCTVLLIIAVTSNCDDLVSALGCDELDDSSEYTEMCQGSTVKHPYCPPGKRLIYPCEGICDYCPTGQYQDKHNTCETCRNCTTRADCDRFEHVLISQCKSDTDAKCGCPTYPTCETCPPVEPDKESLGSCNDRVHKGWRIWGIFAIIIFLLLLLGCPLLYVYLRKVPQPKGYKDIPLNYIPTEDPPANNDATQPEESPLRGAEGGDPSPGITSESSTNKDRMTSAPGADSGDMKLNGLQFSNAAIGNEEVTEDEINEVAEKAYKHLGTYFTSVDRFCSKFGMKRKYYRRVLEEKKSRAVPDQLFYAIMNWHDRKPQTKEAFRKSLCKVDKRLGIWYVGYVNDPENDQQ